MSSFKYVASGGYLSTIERIEIERETPACVWIKGVRREKRSGFESVHDTFLSAKTYLIFNAEEDLIASREVVARKAAALARIHNLSEASKFQ